MLRNVFLETENKLNFYILVTGFSFEQYIFKVFFCRNKNSVYLSIVQKSETKKLLVGYF
jgi:hypothetical protein